MNQKWAETKKDLSDETTRTDQLWAAHKSTMNHFMVADEPEVMTWEVEGVRVQCKHAGNQVVDFLAVTCMACASTGDHGAGAVQDCWVIRSHLPSHRTGENDTARHFFRCRKRPFGVVETATVLLAKTHQWPFVGLLQIDRKVTNMDHNAHWVDMQELADDLEKVEPRHALRSLCTSVRPDDLFTCPSQS